MDWWTLDSSLRGLNSMSRQVCKPGVRDKEGMMPVSQVGEHNPSTEQSGVDSVLRPETYGAQQVKAVLCGFVCSEFAGSSSHSARVWMVGGDILPITPPVADAVRVAKSTAVRMGASQCRLLCLRPTGNETRPQMLAQGDAASHPHWIELIRCPF